MASYVLDKQNDTWVPAEAAPAPYIYAIAEGEVSGHSTLFKYGARTTVSQGTASTIWEGTDNLYVYLPSGQTLNISGDTNEDSQTGSGAYTLVVQGLGNNWTPYSETVTLDGTGIVNTTGIFIRQNRAFVGSCGASYSNIGEIAVRDSTDSITTSLVKAGEGQTLLGLWTVPSGQSLYVTEFSISTSSNKGAEVSLFTRINDGTGGYYPWRVSFRQYSFQGADSYPFPAPVKINEMTDIEVRVTTPVSAGDTSFGASFGGWYEAN
jgi:hypothetical protein